jgi:hypothetical protein
MSAPSIGTQFMKTKPKSKQQAGIKIDPRSKKPKGGPPIVTPLPEKKKPVKPLSPEMAERMIRSLTRLYNDYMEITDADFERITADIVKRVVAK